jgi:hypothetical protein
MMLGVEWSKARLRGRPRTIRPLAAQSSLDYIITMAKGGERDAKWLADSALLYLSQQKLTRTPPEAVSPIPNA